MTKLYDLVEALRTSRIHFTLASYREGAVMILATVPGQRWEIEVFEDESVQVEIFTSAGDIGEENQLRRLMREFSD